MSTGLLDNSTAAVYIESFCVISATLISFVLLIYHISMYRAINPKQNTARPILYCLCLLFLFLVFLFNFFSSLSAINGGVYPNSMDCKYKKMITIGLFNFLKMTLIVLFTYRLFIVFKETLMEFNHKTEIITYSLLTMHQIIGLIVLALFTDGKDINNVCTAVIHPFVLLYALTSEIIIFTSLLVSFSRRLWQLHLLIETEHMSQQEMSETFSTSSKSQSQSKTKKAGFLLRIMRKTMILGSIAMYSTAFFYIIMIIAGKTLIWSTMDTIINSICVMLMFSKYHYFYNICCKCIEHRISDRCLACWACDCCCRIHNPSIKDEIGAVSV